MLFLEESLIKPRHECGGVRSSECLSRSEGEGMPVQECTDARSSYGLNARSMSLATFLRRLSPVQSLAGSAIAVAASRWISM